MKRKYPVMDMVRTGQNIKRINLAANICGFTPSNLGKLIKDGVLSDVEGIHRKIIDRATEKSCRNDYEGL